MDSLGWSNPTPIQHEIATSTCIWSTTRYDNFSEPKEYCSDINDNVDELRECIYSAGLELQGVRACDTMISSNNIGGVCDDQMAGMLAPAPFDSVGGISSLDLIKLAAAAAAAGDSAVLARSQQATATATTACWCADHIILSNSDDRPLLCSSSLVPIVRSQHALLENLSSVENFQNLSYSTTPGGGGNISSGESENCASFDRSALNIRDEAASQSSSNPEPPQLESSNPRAHKRKLEDQECCHLRGSLLQSGSPAAGGGSFQIVFGSADGGSNNSSSKGKRSKGERNSGNMNIEFSQESSYEPDTEAIAQVKEMMYRAAAMRPVGLGAEEAAAKPRRKNVRISSDPQTVAARHRRERISERLRVLQRLVPGGSKMDTASMLDEAASYLKFLKSQVRALETLGGGGGKNDNIIDGSSSMINSSSSTSVTVLTTAAAAATSYCPSNNIVISHHEPISFSHAAGLFPLPKS